MSTDLPSSPGFRCGFCGAFLVTEDLFLGHLQDHHKKRKRKVKVKNDYIVSKVIKPDPCTFVNSNQQDLGKLTGKLIVQEHEPVNFKEDLTKPFSSGVNSGDLNSISCIKPKEGQSELVQIFPSLQPPKKSPYPDNLQIKPVRLPASQDLYSCPDCCFRCSSSDVLADHVTLRHAGKVRQLVSRRAFMDCDECCFRAQDRQALEKHKRVLHDVTASDHGVTSSGDGVTSLDKPTSSFYGCPQCSFRAQTSERLNKHISVLHKVTSVYFDCDKCSFRGADTAALELHARVRHSDADSKPARRRKTINCLRCSFSTSNSLKLALHDQSAHNSEDD